MRGSIEPTANTSARRRWELNREALDHLLETLAPDREAASRRYEALRRRLIDLFAWERCEASEELADEALNRLARRLLEGVTLEGAQVERYTFGIARLLMHEAARSLRTREAALKDFQLEAARHDTNPALGHLSRCLDRLPGESRALIERYYGEDRATLARSLGISLNALRNRALRVREQLYDCVSRSRDVS